MNTETEIGPPRRIRRIASTMRATPDTRRSSPIQIKWTYFASIGRPELGHLAAPAIRLLREPCNRGSGRIFGVGIPSNSMACANRRSTLASTRHHRFRTRNWRYQAAFIIDARSHGEQSLARAVGAIIGILGE